MKIAFLADSLDFQYGGIHVYTRELLLALSKIDTKNEYVILRNKKTNDFPNCEEIAVPYSTFPGYRAWRLFHQLPKIAAKNKVDIVVEPAHFGPFNLPSSIKRVTVIHDLTMFLFPQDHLFWSQFLQRQFLPRILRKADHIITNSQNTTNDLAHFFPFTKPKTTSILLGQNKRFVPQQTATTVLKKYNINHPFLLCTATLEPRKNIPLLIRAFDEFKGRTGLPHQLVLVGKTGWKTDAIFTALESAIYKKDILRLGYVEAEELPALYGATDLFIYPSKYEGFGLPVLEAMSCGAAVLVSRRSSLPEVGGTAAHYFSPDSQEELVTQIVALCTNETLRKAAKTRSLAQAQLFSWEKTARETLAVFESM
jgi:glycosyltransferase involved in cell wall biosynthesis